ncbi:MAG: DUF2330 domain-containing protein [Myxococcales bacterium]|nr:DUF2330 domain-containing protein [Myxococcales bacterium]
MKLAVVAALLALLVDHAPAEACATAPPRGAEARVADEEAVIIWDAAGKRETFIRRARFHSTAKQFGFLVPTPTKPELGEVDVGVFQKLAELIRPEVVVDESGTEVEVASLITSCTKGDKKSKSADGVAAPAVRVIQSAHVAGLDATTVAADDPKALADWLGSHGFESTPQLEAWLGIYTQQRWMITAFVIGGDAGERAMYDVATKAVKMTFATDVPFYPYREPEQKDLDPPELALPPRMLRVFFVSDQRYTGKGWSASTLYSAAVQLPGELWSVKGNDRLTVFIDDASPRIAKDEVFFAPHTDQSEVKQPPLVVHRPRRIQIPLEAVAFASILVLLLIVRRQRKKHAA